MSKIVVAGRIGSVDELKTVATKDGNNSVLTFSVADSDVQKDSGEDPWYRVSIWGKRAEGLAPYIKKGVPVQIIGNLFIRDYTKKDGTAGYSKEIRGSRGSSIELTLMGSRTEGDAPASAPASAPAPAATPAPAADVDDGFMNIPDGVDEELPFN